MNTPDTAVWKCLRSTHIFFCSVYPALCDALPVYDRVCADWQRIWISNRLNNSRKQLPALFEATLAKPGIQHKLIKPYTSRHKGKVERSHRKDNEYFYASHKFYSFEDFKKQLTVWERKYNKFPMKPLDWQSPKSVLFSFSDCKVWLTTYIK